MVPQGLSFNFDPGSRSLVASYAPAADKAAENPAPEAQVIPMEVADLEACLVEQGYGELRRHAAALGVLADNLKAGKPVAALAVAEAVDALAEISVAPDKMAAFLTVTPPQGGQAIADAAIRQALARQGVVAGIREEAITQAVAEGQAASLLVAEGRPAQHGEDGRIEELIPQSRSRVPQVNEKGLMDYRNLGTILTVQAGDAVMQRIPATPGIPGETVSGAVIPALAGKEAMFSPNLTGVAPVPDDPNTLAAAITGQPVRTRDGVSVEPTYVVDEVTINTGNISFDGAVTVKGDVQAGMTIRASGDIEIGGTVEAAILVAGGDIAIKGGAIGARGRKDSQGNEIPSYIQCGGSFTATYVQQAKVEAGDGIFIDDVAMQSDLTATNQIVVGHKQRGHIIGGRLQATLLVKAKVIGSAAHITTRIDIGLDPKLRAQQQRLVLHRQQMEEQLAQVLKLLELAAKMPERVPPETLKRGRITRESLLRTLARLGEEEAVLQEQLRLSQNAKVVAEQAVFEGMEVHCGQLHYLLEGDKPHGLLVRVAEGALEADQLARGKA